MLEETQDTMKLKKKLNAILGFCINKCKDMGEFY